MMLTPLGGPVSWEVLRGLGRVLGVLGKVFGESVGGGLGKLAGGS